MANNHNDGVTALVALRQALDANSSLSVIGEGGYQARAYFAFAAPAQLQEIEQTQQKLLVTLPLAYRTFLLYCNGARLYYPSPAIWGFQLYGTSELAVKNTEWRSLYGEQWPAAALAFGEWMADPIPLVMDTNQPTEDGSDCAVMDGDGEDTPDEWTRAAPGFGDWLDRLVVAQGAAYWRWY